MEENVATAMAKNGNETEDIWMTELQRIAGPDAELSTEAQAFLHALRMDRYAVTADKIRT